MVRHPQFILTPWTAAAFYHHSEHILHFKVVTSLHSDDRLSSEDYHYRLGFGSTGSLDNMLHSVTRRRVLRTATLAMVGLSTAGCLNDNDDDVNNDGPAELDPDDEIVLDGYSTHWELIEPSEHEGALNPLLVLQDGEEYTFEWVNADGLLHNLQIWDGNEQLIDDLTTEDVGTEGEAASLTFTATPEMAIYACEYHPQQRGPLQIA